MRGMPSDDEMSSLYSDDSPNPTSKGPEDEVEGTTALVPVKLLQGPGGEPVKEGDEIVVRVVALHDDEAEVEYAPKEGGKSEESEESPEKELEEMDNGEKGY